MNRSAPLSHARSEGEGSFQQMRRHLDIFCCPGCGGDLMPEERSISCRLCRQIYGSDGGIPLLFLPNDWDHSKKDVTDAMKAFYEQSPFPNYEDCESIGDLVHKAEKGMFARLLNEQIPFQSRVLEVGCGTGQLSNFLAIAQRHLFGVDMCLHSLQLGHEFRQRHHLERASFYQMNLFRPIFKKESFPIVICNGVLHHTSDPFTGFQSIARLVKPGGYIVIGLYHRYGRLVTDLRRIIFRVTGNRLLFLDPQLRRGRRGERRQASWFSDQYQNPHESKHTIGEVLKWFAKTGFRFAFGIPNPVAFESFRWNDRLFEEHPHGNVIDHLLTQFGLLFSGSQEGGFFIMIGKKEG